MELRKAKENEHPRCPHCDRDLKEIVAHKFSKGFMQVTDKQIYSCPHCKKVLGIAQSAWMP